jgi:CSLREA domain-containing protein
MAVLALSLLLLVAAPARAGVFTVTTTADVAGTCPGSNCSLREAIKAANASNDDDTINVPAAASHYTVGTSLPQFTNSSVTIVGGGAAATIVDGGGSFALFDQEAAGKSISVSGLTITGGKIAGGASGNQGGAAIRNQGASLTVADSTLTGNAVTATGGGNNGGAIYNNGSALTITNSTLNGNSITETGASGNVGGGAAYNNGADLSISGSTFSGNTVSVTGSSGNDGGGAVYHNGSNITIVNSSFTGNTATVTSTNAGNVGGGGLYNNGSILTVTGSRFTGNSVSVTANTNPAGNSGGGAVYHNGADISFAGSDLSNNTATLTGKTAGNSGGGGLYNNGSKLVLDASSVTGNQESAQSGTFSGGGGIYHNGSATTFTNSTIANNSAGPPGGGSNNGGGGLFQNGTATGSLFQNVTFGSNSTTAKGGSVFNDTTAALPAKDTIVSGGSAGAGGANCAGPGGGLASQGNNLDSGNDCGLGAAGDKVNANAALGAVGDHGGGTLTQMLLAGSAALDAGAGCPGTDQRGVSRPQGAACDMGAAEDQLPTAATGPVGAVTATSAIVNGDVNPLFTPGVWRFQYGTTTVYGAATPDVDAGDGAGNESVSATLTGLAPHTTYHYRVAADNAAGSAFGDDATFTTLFPDPSVSGFVLRPRNFRRAKGRTAIAQAKRRRVPRGSSFRFRLNEVALVRIRIYRELAGRRSGRRCVAPSKRLRRARRCTRLRAKGTLTRRKPRAGANRVKFTGRIGRRALTAGPYRAVITATVTGAARPTSPARTARFRILPG